MNPPGHFSGAQSAWGRTSPIKIYVYEGPVVCFPMLLRRPFLEKLPMSRVITNKVRDRGLVPQTFDKMDHSSDSSLSENSLFSCKRSLMANNHRNLEVKVLSARLVEAGRGRVVTSNKCQGSGLWNSVLPGFIWQLRGLGVVTTSDR